MNFESPAPGRCCSWGVVLVFAAAAVVAVAVADFPEGVPIADEH